MMQLLLAPFVGVLTLCLLLLPLRAWASSTTFDAADTRVVVTTAAALNGAAVAACAWTYRTGAGEGTNPRVFDKSTNTVNGWSMYFSTTTYGVAAYFPTNRRIGSFNDPGVNQWHHFCFTWTPTVSNLPVVFIDGVSVTVTDSSTAASGTWANTSNLIIGNVSTAIQTWGGRIAEVGVWNREITVNEAKTIMRRGPKARSNGLITYYPLGHFLGLNLTTNSFAGTETLGAGSHNGNGPPLSYIQGGSFE